MSERKHLRFAGQHHGLFQPDVILPSQLFGEFDGHPPPEKRLMVAVIDDAVNCFRKYRFATDRRGRQLFREAEQWLLGVNRRWAFSFESICEVLGLDPDYLRGGLRRWQAEQIARRTRTFEATVAMSSDAAHGSAMRADSSAA